MELPLPLRHFGGEVVGEADLLAVEVELEARLVAGDDDRRAALGGERAALADRHLVQIGELELLGGAVLIEHELDLRVTNLRSPSPASGSLAVTPEAASSLAAA